MIENMKDVESVTERNKKTQISDGVIPIKHEPLISVIIPTFNRATTIIDSVLSVLSQTWKNLEIIIVDDGSTDSTEEILQPYLNSIHYLKKENGGLAAARNTGFNASRGEFIAWLDSDDVFLPEKLEMQVNFMLDHPEMVVSSTDFSEWRNEKIIQNSHIASYYVSINRRPGGIHDFYQVIEANGITGLQASDSKIWTGKGYIYKDLVWGNFIHPPTVMIRRTAIESVGSQDETLPNMSDYEYFLRLSRIGTFGFIDKPLLLYRYSDDMLSGPRNSLSIWISLIEITRRVLRDDPNIIPIEKKKEFLQRLGIMYLRLAEVQAEAGDIHFLKAMVRGLYHRPSCKIVALILGKAVMPKKLLKWMREVYKTLS